MEEKVPKKKKIGIGLPSGPVENADRASIPRLKVGILRIFQA